MYYRKLGRSGVAVSEVALGSWLTFGNATEEATARDCVAAAWDLGINFFDTADVYARGKAEEFLGRALRPYDRRRLFVATKCFFPMSEDPNDQGLSRKHIVESVNASLRRLGMDYIDLMQCHRFDPQTPLEETLRAMDDLVRAGKILYWGVSMWTAEQIARLMGLVEQSGAARPISNQPSYSLLARGIEAEVIPTCQREGLGQVVFSPLAQGVLTGKYTRIDQLPPESRAADPRQNQFIGRYLTQEILDKVQKIAAVARRLGLTPATLALAWCLRQENVSSVIIGASRPAQVAENAKASGVTLDPAALEEIDTLLKS